MKKIILYAFFFFSFNCMYSAEMSELKKNYAFQTVFNFENNIEYFQTSKNQSKIALAIQDTGIVVYDRAMSKPLKFYHFSREEHGRVVSIDFSPDGLSFVVVFGDGVLKLFSLNHEQAVRTINSSDSHHYMAQFSPCGQFIVTAQKGKKVVLYNIQDGSIINEITLSNNLDERLPIGISSNLVLLIDHNRKLTIINKQNNTVVYNFDNVQKACFSECGKFVFVLILNHETNFANLIKLEIEKNFLLIAQNRVDVDMYGFSGKFDLLDFVLDQKELIVYFPHFKTHADDQTRRRFTVINFDLNFRITHKQGTELVYNPSSKYYGGFNNGVFCINSSNFIQFLKHKDNFLIKLADRLYPIVTIENSAQITDDGIFIYEGRRLVKFSSDKNVSESVEIVFPRSQLRRKIKHGLIALGGIFALYHIVKFVSK